MRPKLQETKRPVMPTAPKRKQREKPHSSARADREKQLRTAEREYQAQEKRRIEARLKREDPIGYCINECGFNEDELTPRKVALLTGLDPLQAEAALDAHFGRHARTRRGQKARKASVTAPAKRVKKTPDAAAKRREQNKLRQRRYRLRKQMEREDAITDKIIDQMLEIDPSLTRDEAWSQAYDMMLDTRGRKRR